MADEAVGPVLRGYDGATPEVAATAWVAPGAVLVGRVSLGEQASVWYGAVLRGDSAAISIGARTNLQDGCVCHANPSFPLQVGSGVTVGHRAVLHGCVVDDDVLVGMGAVVMNGAHIGRGSLVAAGAVVLEQTDVPPGSLVAGVPAKVRRGLSDDEIAMIPLSAATYVELAGHHAGQG